MSNFRVVNIISKYFWDIYCENSFKISVLNLRSINIVSIIGI